ncbi:hypothetical protein KK137_15725 [Croceibacterium sp. LX-88]|uniref:YD repeat-containing protein n=1 Tax=Croceibacterium selenioxidans TaxID=2838833 RepID=A0ABS5W7P1_9SPHN|nr:hypothetical protein [Croceibacterium selenioxidans]MBT2135788.1 hypothetical protein [Croceibacterium selenioxidans]
MLFGPQISQSSLKLLSSGSRCVTFKYDVNGNRIAQTVGTIASGPVQWGSGKLGCFVWNK